MDPRTKETELEVQNIINLHRIANELPEAFTNPKGIMKSHIPAVNAPERIEIPHDEVDELKEFRLASSTSNMRKRGREPVAKVLKEPSVQHHIWLDCSCSCYCPLVLKL